MLHFHLIVVESFCTFEIRLACIIRAITIKRKLIGKGGLVSRDLESEELQRTFAALGFVTGSDALFPILRRAWRAACASDITVLLEGATGTGKQVLAQAIHRLDQKRRSFPFVTVHCGAIAEHLAESEFFGHQRGAFSGAVANRKGLFQSAQLGTLFLDDVNDLLLALQPKLLDAIQRRTVRPVGSDRETPIDLRIVAASNQPLHPLVQQNRFRADLYHRLNVVRVALPALRERDGDLGALVLALAQRHGRLYATIESVEPQLVRHLEAQSFPGNVRELENAIQRMLFLKGEGKSLGMADWHAAQSEEGAARKDGAESDQQLLDEAAGSVWRAISQRGMPYAQALREVERKVLENALSEGRCTRREIARRLSTSERTLYHKLRAHQLGCSKLPAGAARNVGGDARSRSFPMIRI